MDAAFAETLDLFANELLIQICLRVAAPWGLVVELVFASRLEGGVDDVVRCEVLRRSHVVRLIVRLPTSIVSGAVLVGRVPHLLVSVVLVGDADVEVGAELLLLVLVFIPFEPGVVCFLHSWVCVLEWGRLVAVGLFGALTHD